MNIGLLGPLEVSGADGRVRIGGAKERLVLALALYERLLPWHDQFATTYITPLGAVAHSLGALAHALDRHDEAAQWFREALALHEALHAPFFIASTQAAWAALLADRDEAGDSRRAQALADTAFAVATGYGYIARDARSVLERSA